MPPLQARKRQGRPRGAAGRADGMARAPPAVHTPSEAAPRRPRWPQPLASACGHTAAAARPNVRGGGTPAEAGAAAGRRLEPGSGDEACRTPADAWASADSGRFRRSRPACGSLCKSSCRAFRTFRTGMGPLHPWEQQAHPPHAEHTSASQESPLGTAVAAASAARDNAAAGGGAASSLDEQPRERASRKTLQAMPVPVLPMSCAGSSPAAFAQDCSQGAEGSPRRVAQHLRCAVQ
jgi:hypothetical protein